MLKKQEELWEQRVRIVQTEAVMINSIEGIGITLFLQIKDFFGGGVWRWGGQINKTKNLDWFGLVLVYLQITRP